MLSDLDPHFIVYAYCKEEDLWSYAGSYGSFELAEDAMAASILCGNPTRLYVFNPSKQFVVYTKTVDCPQGYTICRSLT